MKKRITFLAGMYLAAASALMSAEISLSPGDDLKYEIEMAMNGDVFILKDGTYDVESSIMILADVTIKAENEGMAILKGYQFTVPDNMTISEIVFDGIVASHTADEDSKYFLQVNNATANVGSMIIRNCNFSDYSRGILRATTEGAKIDNILIDNCVFESISRLQATYAQINPQKASVQNITIINSTFYNSPAGVLRYEGAVPLNLVFENCTVLNCGSVLTSPTNSDRNNRKMIELKEVASTLVKNCIFSGSYDSETPENKPISLGNAGSVEDCLLEGYSDPLTEKVVSESLVNATVESFDFSQLTITLSGEGFDHLGDPRWTVKGTGGEPSGIVLTGGSEKEVIAVEYYDLLGKQLSEDAKGLFIEKSIYEDGSVSTKKMIK